ncbi:uncharacterized protein CMC5_084280 [Chondromyces crocatus]|uniref:Uncharacterized protein n=1 Tax=Chondromyces crocatus TaxID=52 RepID=A0A0K1EU85_CHOCO|nr:uncharacterized protein CMC5_084280 [Chondromyces crocatus]
MRCLVRRARSLRLAGLPMQVGSIQPTKKKPRAYRLLGKNRHARGGFREQRGGASPTEPRISAALHFGRGGTDRNARGKVIMPSHLALSSESDEKATSRCPD